MLKEIDLFIQSLMENSGVLAPLLACLLIVVESIIPVLPLFVFITINFVYFGSFWGFIISWVMTVIGCYISFKLCRHKVKIWFDSKIVKRHELRLTKWLDIVSNISLEKLVVLLTIPFAPAFLINIVAGISSMNEKKYVIALIIGKVFLVYFWGFVGTNLVKSLQQPMNLVIVFICVLAAFLISKFVKAHYGLE